MRIKGRIRTKILAVVLPILMITSGFIGFTAYLSSKNGITRIAKEFLGYQLNELYKFATRQNETIQAMQLSNDTTLIANAQNATLEYSRTVSKSQSGGFLILDSKGLVVLSTMTNRTLELNSKHRQEISQRTSGWIEMNLGSIPVVGVFIEFSSWQQVFLLWEEKEVFYQNVNEIVRYLFIILGASIIISSLILLSFINKITRPIDSFMRTIQGITEKMDLTQRVRIQFADEIGVLGHYFNSMLSELEGAYNQIKNYAYQTVLAKKKEERVRFIFQKFVPQEVINQVLNLSSDSMLIGARQKVSILFSDIRGFTTISENMQPEDLVLSLNAYFDTMVSLIMDNHGTIDKFIGDAIMAIFGAPLVREDDAENAIRTALLMIEALEGFNDAQLQKGLTIFQIGVGINTGQAIVGNIGSEQKIDYTVIGDTVNLASRLEGLTKKYKVPVIISEFSTEDISPGTFYFREVDIVRVKGKQKPVRILQPFFLQTVQDRKEYYDQFQRALEGYYRGDFKPALTAFQALLRQNPEDRLNEVYIERCQHLLEHPPASWDGVETWTEK